MSDRAARVLARLADVGFSTRSEPIMPFGEPLALVGAVAWDATTSQLALIAELDSDQDDDSWRQLLFAGSGIRHQLAGDGPAAYGTPVILAILDEECERRLRELVEDLAESYALFNRVEVNLIRHADIANDAALDLALAPLLPNCRRMLDKEISRGEVRRFWETLSREIHAAALQLDPVFATHRERVADDSTRLLIGDSADARELPAPAPVKQIEIENFRTFSQARLDFAPVTVIHGPNGSGKSTVIEGLELSWAGRSRRMPGDISPQEYGRHLPRDGNGTFALTTEHGRIEAVNDTAAGELGRCVLSQESIVAFASSSPQERYLELLATTGLEIPDLKARTAELVRVAKRDADAALSACGIPPLPRSDSDARKHLARHLTAGFAARLPSDDELAALGRTLSEASAGTFTWRGLSDSVASAPLAVLDACLGGVLSDPDAPELATTLDEAQSTLTRLASERQAAAASTSRLLDALRQPPSQQVGDTVQKAVKETPLSPQLAVRWLSHSRSIAEAAERFRTDAEGVKDKRYARQLAAYAGALEDAAATVPSDSLQELSRAAHVPDTSRSQFVIAAELYTDAGFTGVPKEPGAIRPALAELAGELARHAATLHTLAGELAEHPARRFSEHSDRVLGALCRFELARSLRREGPVMRASETLVGELLQTRLAPVLRELVAATVRFEWYFKPLQIPEVNRALVLGGLSTSRADLDARMTLNSAERHVLGVAWFLSLHLLQPEERRRVLVLDDPTAGFDTVNQAGFIATLRAFARLTRPEQLIIATQDDTLAAIFAEELAPVDGWPAGTVRIRCRRDAEDASTTSTVVCPAAAHATSEETNILGVAGDATLAG